jgi:pyrroline-5-carboxylate reductase
MSTLGFIGGGKMAEALIAKLHKANRIVVADTNVNRLDHLSAKYRVKTVHDNLAVFLAAEIIILAIKPQQMAAVLTELHGWDGVENQKKVVVSIAAGIPISYLRQKLPHCQIIRAMPNNPAIVGAGITALVRGRGVRSNEFGVVSRIFKAVGEVMEVEERLMDAVTGLSGSGPAFIYLTLESMIKAGIELGLSQTVAQQLASHTVMGAALTLLRTEHSAAELRKMVTSPGGTTIEGLKVLAEKKFPHALASAIRAAEKKSRQLSKKWIS